MKIVKILICINKWSQNWHNRCQFHNTYVAIVSNDTEQDVLQELQQDDFDSNVESWNAEI